MSESEILEVKLIFFWKIDQEKSYKGKKKNERNYFRVKIFFFKASFINCFQLKTE